MELMLVVAVLGILTAFAVPIYVLSLNKKKAEECRNNRTTFQIVMLSYKSGMLFESGPQTVPRVVITSDSEGNGTITTVDYSALPAENLPLAKHTLTVENLESQFVFVPGCPDGGTFTVSSGSIDCWPTCSEHAEE